MNRIIFIFGFLLITEFGFGAYSLEIVDTTKIWSVLIGQYVYGIQEGTNFYKFSGDSAIANYSYRLVYESYDSNKVNWHFTNDLIREDSNKVYLYQNDSEHILYDFTLTNGDTISLYNMFGQENDWIVDTIDSIEIYGQNRKHIRLQLHNYLYDNWIEGLGSDLGILFSGNFMYDYSTELLCVEQNGLTIYSNPVYNSCYIYTGINNQLNKNEINIYPTITDSWITIETEIYPINLKIMSLTGRIVYDDWIDSKKVNISTIENGFYVIRITDKNGNLRFNSKIVKNN